MKTTKQTQDAFIASLMPDSDKKMVRISGASLIVALMLGFWASTYEALIGEVMFEPTPESPTITTTMKIDEPLKEEPKVKKDVKKNDEKINRKHKGGAAKPKGEGNPRAPVNRGVLKELAIRTSKAGLSPYDLMGTKFAKDIHDVLTHVNGVMKSGKTKIGERRGKRGDKFNPGSIAGGSGGIGDMLDGLLGGSAGAISTQAMGTMKEPKMNEIDMGSPSASRSASEIMKVVKQRTPGLRHVYNKYLKKKPGFQGKVTLKFTIAPGGEIISIAVVGSTTGYAEFDSEVKKSVSGWKFSKIKSGNTTVTIPFTFTE